MAYIETRKNKGGARRYRVWRRLGGSGTANRRRRRSSTRVHDDVQARGRGGGPRLPDDYIEGVGWLVNEPEQPKPAAKPVCFGDYALAYVRGLSGVDARTHHDYERDLTVTYCRSSGTWTSAGTDLTGRWSGPG